MWETWENWLPVKTETKNLLSTSAFSMSVEVSLLIYQREYTPLDLFLLRKVPGKSLLIIFHILCHVQFHLCRGFPDPITACLNSIHVLLLGHMSLLPLPVSVPLFPQPDQQVLPHSAILLPASSPWFPVLGEGELLYPQNSLRFSLLKFWVLLFARLIFLRITNSTRTWLLHPRLPLISSVEVNIRCTNLYPLVGLSNTWSGKLSSVYSRSLLNCLHSSVLLFNGYLSSWNLLSGWEPASMLILVVEARRPHPFDQGACSRPQSEMSFFCLFPNFYLQALDLIIPVSERQLFTIYFLIKRNFVTSLPLVPFPSLLESLQSWIVHSILNSIACL